jgi:AcrR family transcriptional regulator
MFKAPTERLQLYRRDQILSPARDLIRKNEFAQPSLGQIAKQAGLSPSIVSEYFAPKSENFDGCLAVNRETRAEEVAARVADTVNLKAPLPGFLKICHSRAERLSRRRRLFGSTRWLRPEGENGEGPREIPGTPSRFLWTVARV